MYIHQNSLFNICTAETIFETIEEEKYEGIVISTTEQSKTISHNEVENAEGELRRITNRIPASLHLP